MSVDPLIPADSERQELQRLLKENRALREINATLRVAAEAKSAIGNGKAKSAPTGTSGGAKEGCQKNEGEGKTAGNAALLKRMKEEVQRNKDELESARREQQRVKDEYKQLKSVFESFVVEICEREAAYKLVFARIHEEVEEQKSLCESLKRQLQERSFPTEPAPSTLISTSTVTGMDPSSFHDVVGSLRAALGELEHRLGYNGDTGIPYTTPVITNRAARGRTRPVVTSQPPQITNSGSQIQKHEDHPGQQQQTQQQSRGAVVNAQRLVTPARGAGALRNSSLSASQSTVTERKKRERKKMEDVEVTKRHAAEGSSQTNAASLFDSFTHSTERPKGSVVNFGSEPIADYLGLLEKTDASSVDILRRELMKFCASDVSTLVSYAIEHFLGKNVLTAPVVTLWKHTEHVMQIGRGVFSAFVQQTVRKLVYFLGSDSAAAAVRDHSPQLRCLALVLRMACAVQLRDTAQVEDVLFMAFYECTVSVLRTWRLCGAASEQRHVLTLWMTVVRHMCGFVEEFHMVVRYYANSERVLEGLALPKSLSRYAVQAVMTSCYLTSFLQSELKDNESMGAENWVAFCDAMDWSCSELPCETIGAAAAKILARSEDAYRRDEALLSLRLLVLQKGFGFLQSLTEQLRASTCEVDLDSVFAELFSLAVIDLRLEDPRDEQWIRAMAFFADYLSATSVEQMKSAEELCASCKDTHVLVLRAVLHLCHNTSALTEDGIEHLSRTLQWTKVLSIVLKRFSRENAGGVGASSYTEHPFLCTLRGRELLSLCHQEL